MIWQIDKKCFKDWGQSNQQGGIPGVGQGSKSIIFITPALPMYRMQTQVSYIIRKPVQFPARIG